MAAALIVALAAGAELVGWKISGGARALAVVAWLAVGLVLAADGPDRAAAIARRGRRPRSSW